MISRNLADSGLTTLAVALRRREQGKAAFVLNPLDSSAHPNRGWPPFHSSAHTNRGWPPFHIRVSRAVYRAGLYDRPRRSLARWTGKPPTVVVMMVVVVRAGLKQCVVDDC